MCAEPIDDAHSHVVDVESRALMCVCRACYLLFVPGGAAGGHYRAVPDRYLDAGSVFTDADWDELQIPVGIAFFFVNSSLGRPVAFYPSPAGATESLLPLTVWRDIGNRNPVVANISPDVEALLARRREAAMPENPGVPSRLAFESYVVPIDACYELVGRMRRHWKGFDGGEEVRDEIERFFGSVRGKSAIASGSTCE